MIVISDDGYVRLADAALRAVRLTHHLSGLDQAPTSNGGTRTTAITGYTEWIGETVITIGWDWRMHADSGVVALSRISEPRSNVMMLDANGADIGHDKTAAVLGSFIDRFAWQPEVQAYIDKRYGYQL
jgi:uncharacterized protein DUF4902